LVKLSKINLCNRFCLLKDGDDDDDDDDDGSWWRVGRATVGINDDPRSCPCCCPAGGGCRWAHGVV
jgi:hypothetical protein